MNAPRIAATNPPAVGTAGPVPIAAAARSSGPFPSGGGNSSPSVGATTAAPLDPLAAARLPSRECLPGGGLCGEFA